MDAPKPLRARKQRAMPGRGSIRPIFTSLLTLDVFYGWPIGGRKVKGGGVKNQGNYLDVINARHVAWNLRSVTTLFFADLKWCHLLVEFAGVFLIQIISIGLALGVILLLATIFDAASRSMSWYSNKWLIFGLFYCPIMFCLGILPATYVSYKNKVLHLLAIHKPFILKLIYIQKLIGLSCYIQMFLHSHTIVYIILILTMTGMGLRSAFILLFALIFNAVTAYINLFARLQLRGIDF